MTVLMPRQPGLMDDVRKQAFFQGLTQLGAGLMSAPTGSYDPGGLNPWPHIGQGVQNMQRVQGQYLDKNKKAIEEQRKREMLEKAGGAIFNSNGGGDRKEAIAKALWAAGQPGAAARLLLQEGQAPQVRTQLLPGGKQQDLMWQNGQWLPMGEPVNRWKGGSGGQSIYKADKRAALLADRDPSSYNQFGEKDQAAWLRNYHAAGGVGGGSPQPAPNTAPPPETRTAGVNPVAAGLGPRNVPSGAAKAMRNKKTGEVVFLDKNGRPVQ